MDSPARPAHEQAPAPQASALAALTVLGPIAIRHNAPVMQLGTIPVISPTAMHQERPCSQSPFINAMPMAASAAPSSFPPASTGTRDDSPSSSDGDSRRHANRSGSGSRGGASSSDSAAVYIHINDPLGIKAMHSSSDAATPQPPPTPVTPKEADPSSFPQWLLLPLRSHGDGSSASSSDGSATVPKLRSKGRWGALTPAWWARSKGRAFGIISGMATVVALAALMTQLGIIGSQRSTLQLPLLADTLQSAAARGAASTAKSPAAHATDALAALLLMYDPGQGLFSGMGWWNQANALEAIIDHAMLTNSSDFNALLANTFDKTGELRYLGNYYDDEGWWGITWAKAYTLTGRQDYRDVAVSIYTDMQVNGWQEVCGGGMLWRRGQGYRATISSGLYMMLAMLLHKSATDPAEKDGYVQAVGQTWRWLLKTGILPSSGRLVDGMEGDCTLRKTPLFSYNQGVVMGALSLMTAATGDGRYLTTAYKIADAGIRAITNSAGIITDDCDPNLPNIDGCQFKGVFVRYLYDLYTIHKTPSYKQLLLKNAASAWNSRDNSTNKIGISWRGSYVSKAGGEGVTQTAGLDLFNAALGIQLYG